MREEIFCGQDWNEDILDMEGDDWEEEQEFLSTFEDELMEEITEDEEEQEYIDYMLSRNKGW